MRVAKTQSHSDPWFTAAKGAVTQCTPIKVHHAGLSGHSKHYLEGPEVRDCGRSILRPNYAGSDLERAPQE